MLAPSGYFGAFFGALFAASAGNGVSAVSADSTTTYPVRSAAASSVSAAYPVRGSVQRDAAASYSVLSSSAVVTSNAVAYQVLCAAHRDGDAAYQVRSSVAASGGALIPCLYVSTTAKVAVVVSCANVVFAEQDKRDTSVFTPCLGVVLED